ncbi:MAG: hypothetical protein IAF38_01305 [Bacteroidia bacterium]|nr:hypothetical protein [Bacteroidia bacterium]
MKNIIDFLTEDFDEYLNYSLKGFKEKVNAYTIDFTRGETVVSKLLCVEKTGHTEKEALIILTQRLLMINEEWLSFDDYSKEDVIRWTDYLKNNYEKASYLTNISLPADKDNCFITGVLASADVQSINYNKRHLSVKEFRDTNPLMNEQIISVSKSEFERLECEFYIETTSHFLLYNWYTTA